ncbi:hypothetical protein GCM10023069_18710 [Shinella granuli]
MFRPDAERQAAVAAFARGGHVDLDAAEIDAVAADADHAFELQEIHRGRADEWATNFVAGQS